RRFAAAVAAGPVATHQDVMVVVRVSARAHDPLFDVARQIVDAEAALAAALRAALRGLVELFGVRFRFGGGPLREDRLIHLAPLFVVVAARLFVAAAVRVLAFVRAFARRDPFVLAAEALVLRRAPRFGVLCGLHDERAAAAFVRRFVAVDARVADARH